jgi:folate-binding protein YgfZ
VLAPLPRMRLRAQCEIEPEEHESELVFGGEGIESDFPGAVEVLDAGLEPTLSVDELELRRIEAGVPRWGRELDGAVLPAEAGLDATHISFTKGCYPGQEPIARLHYRGHVNRKLQVVQLDDETAVERVTSSARRPDGTVVALAYVRTQSA